MLSQHNSDLSSSSNNSNSTGSGPAVSLKSARNSAIAGYTAGFVGVVFGHPLDSLKVWAQTSSSGKNKHFIATTTATESVSGAAKTSSASIVGNASSSPSTTSNTTAPQHVGLTGNTSSGNTSRPSIRAMSTLVSSKRAQSTSSSSSTSSYNIARMVRALYSGASVPLFTVGIVQSINFATYDGMRRILHRADTSRNSDGNNHLVASSNDYLHNDSLMNVGIAGFVTGTGLACITSPLIMIKTSQQVTGNGFREAVQSTLYPNGRWNIAGCFAGFTPHLLSETIGRAVYYAVYEGCKRYISSCKQEQGLTPSITLFERMGSAATAGIVCWTAIYPLDVLRNRMYSQVGRSSSVVAGGGTAVPILSTWEMAQSVYREKAMYRGFSLTVLRAGPVAAMVLPVYDLVLEHLSTSEW